MIRVLKLVMAITLFERYKAGSGNWQTKFVVELTTKGAKTPKTNPFNISAFEDLGPDQLLPNGERMHYLLGNQIQILYSDILNEKTKETSLFLYSSMSTPAQQSAASHLMGIFPKNENNKVIQGFEILKDPPYDSITVDRLDSDSALPHKQRPFNFVVESEENDFLFVPDIIKLCPKFSSLSKQIFSKLFKGLKAKDLEYVVMLLRKSLRHIKFFGEEIQEINEDHLSAIYASVMANYYYTGKYLKGFNADAVKLLSIAEGMRIMGKKLKTKRQVEMYNHHKLTHIIEQFDIVKNVTNYSKKFMFMSGDKVNMLALLKAFNKTSYRCLRKRLKDKNLTETPNCLLTPKPASSLVFELMYHAKAKEYNVRVLYNGQVIKICDGGTKTYCLYEQWKKEMEAYYMSQSYFTVCGNDHVSIADEERMRTSIRSDTLTVKIMLGIFMVQVCMVGLICYCKKKGEQKIVEEALMDTMKKAKFSLNY